MMMHPYGGETLTMFLIHASYVLYACSFLLRDILWLRAVAILANLLFAYAAFRAPGGPNWVTFGWVSAFVVINTAHSLWLLYERHVARLSEQEKRLVDAAFQGLDPVLVRKLLRRGRWRSFEKEARLADKGAHLDRLSLIASGEADVRLGERTISHLSCGKFVGEISYLSGEPATATVVASTPVECLVWEKKDLRKLTRRRPEYLNVIHAAIGKDLARKTAQHNLKLLEV